MTTGKTIALTRRTFVGKVMPLLFNMLSRLVITFLPNMAAITICSDFGAPQNKVSHCFHCFSIYLHEVMEPDGMILVFWMLSFKPTFSLSSFTFIKRLWPQGMWDLSSPTRDQIYTPCIRKRSLSHWAARKSLWVLVLPLNSCVTEQWHKTKTHKDFLVAQWLRLRLPMQRVYIWSLVGERRSHMPWGQNTKT